MSHRRIRHTHIHTNLMTYKLWVLLIVSIPFCVYLHVGNTFGFHYNVSNDVSLVSSHWSSVQPFLRSNCCLWQSLSQHNQLLLFLFVENCALERVIIFIFVLISSSLSRFCSTTLTLRHLKRLNTKERQMQCKLMNECLRKLYRIFKFLTPNFQKITIKFISFNILMPFILKLNIDAPLS